MTVEDTIAARDGLASYNKPKRVSFVDKISKTVTGKLLKRDLRDRFPDDSN